MGTKNMQSYVYSNTTCYISKVETIQNAHKGKTDKLSFFTKEYTEMKINDLKCHIARDESYKPSIKLSLNVHPV